MKNLPLLNKIEELEQKAIPIIGAENFHMALSNILMAAFAKKDTASMDEVIALIQEKIDIADAQNAKNGAA